MGAGAFVHALSAGPAVHIGRQVLGRHPALEFVGERLRQHLEVEAASWAEPPVADLAQQL
ncbi:hypothetical protein GCM10010336_75330 [Streptomyces goshikiensis]|nr:hypothetical protein GCM10010336_75330 [Streptomyces goshikiensis]